MTSLNDLSLDELHARLEELNAEWYAVAQAIEARENEDRKQLADAIKNKVEGAGYDIQEILGLVEKKKGNSRKSGRTYARYVDPDNEKNAYVRGVLPRWLKDKMRAKGYDPSAKGDRDSFKEKHLKRVAA
jgi:DNA-binding protein H-NS